jgi:putative colanic acid biosynthesis glycosyltransferase
MKVLQINLFFKHGSTGKIVEEIHNGCINVGIDSYVAYAIGKHNQRNLFKFSSKFFSKIYTYISAFTGKQYTYSYYETFKLIRYIKKIKPDIVNIHVININTVNKYKVLEFLKSKNIKTVITFHSEIFYTGGCSHALECNKWKYGCGNCPNLWEATHSLFFDNTNIFWDRYRSIYSGFDDNLRIVCVSNWLKNRAQESPMLKNKKISVIENGIDTKSIYVPRPFKGDLLNKIGDRKVILHVTPSFKSKIKGGEYVKKIIYRLDPDKYFFIIIGCDPKEIVKSNVKIFNSINNPIELATYYTLADLTLLTSRVETFSMVTAESLSCGTPIVGFKCGAPEEIAIQEFSSFVEYGDIEALLLAITNSLIYHKKREKYLEIAEKASIKYSKEIMVASYNNLYLSM